MEPNAGALRVFARVSRRLDRLSRQDAQILELYYGPAGLSWGGTYHGRLLVLQALTPSGKRLLRKTRKKGDKELTTRDEKLAAQWDLQRTEGCQWRWRLLEAAEREARQLLEQASAAWVQGPTIDWEAERDALYDRIDATAERVEAWLEEFGRYDGVAIQQPDGVYR